MAVGAIVVGLDGSPSSRDALRWALDEARVRRTTVEAVHVWRLPALTYAAVMAAPIAVRDELGMAAKAMLDQEVDDVLATELDPPPVERVALEGAAAAGLVRCAVGADLLVLGHSSGLPALLRGSVGQRCAAHAGCPVVVVRGAVREAVEARPDRAAARLAA